MDPLTIISLGSAVFRGIGALFGGKTATIANTVADIADQTKGMTADAAQAHVAAAIAALPPDAQVQLKQLDVQLAQIQATLQTARLTADTAQQAQQAQTARAEIASSDEYVRHTRPMIARLSFYSVIGYSVVVGVAFPLVTLYTGKPMPLLEPWIISALASPLLTYIGARTVDSFSPTGRTGTPAT